MASEEEIRYLLDETNRVFPAANLTVDDIHYAYAGVRPLPRRDRGPESAITRKHIIKKHRRVAKGLVSIIGGKLTTYRNLAEQAVDYAVRTLKCEARDCATRSLALPGADGRAEAREMLRELSWLSDVGIARLLGIYGGRAREIVDLAAAESHLARTLDDDESVVAAEIVYALRHEFAMTLTDIVHRRIMIGLSADQGAGLSEAIAEIAAREAGWSNSEKERQLEELREYNARLKHV